MKISLEITEECFKIPLYALGKWVILEAAIRICVVKLNENFHKELKFKSN